MKDSHPCGAIGKDNSVDEHGLDTAVADVAALAGVGGLQCYEEIATSA